MAIVPPTVILLTLGAVSVATREPPEPLVPPDVPAAKDLPPGGAAIGLTDGTLYEDLVIQDDPPLPDGEEDLDPCDTQGEDTANFIASNASVVVTVDVVGGRGSVTMKGAQQGEGEPDTVVVGSNEEVAISGPMKRGGEELLFIFTANCNV